MPSDNQLHFRKKLLQKMAVGEKINQSITKLSKTKINMIKLDKLLRFLLYLQDMFMNFWLTKMFCQKKTWNRNEYSSLGKELKVQIGIAKNSFLTCYKKEILKFNKHVAHLQNLSLYYTWKNIKRQYKNNNLKIIVPTWNDEFELPDGSYSVSDIQDYIEYVIKKHETLT